MYSQMYSNLMKRHLKLVALGVEEAETQVQLRNRDCLLYIFNVSGEYKDYTFDYDDMAG